MAAPVPDQPSQAVALRLAVTASHVLACKPKGCLWPELPLIEVVSYWMTDQHERSASFLAYFGAN